MGQNDQKLQAVHTAQAHASQPLHHQNRYLANASIHHAKRPWSMIQSQPTTASVFNLLCSSGQRRKTQFNAVLRLFLPKVQGPSPQLKACPMMSLSPSIFSTQPSPHTDPGYPFPCLSLYPSSQPSIGGRSIDRSIHRLGSATSSSALDGGSDVGVGEVLDLALLAVLY